MEPNPNAATMPAKIPGTEANEIAVRALEKLCLPPKVPARKPGSKLIELKQKITRIVRIITIRVAGISAIALRINIQHRYWNAECCSGWQLPVQPDFKLDCPTENDKTEVLSHKERGP